MRQLTYGVMLTPVKDGGFVVRFADLPESITQGDKRSAPQTQCSMFAAAPSSAEGARLRRFFAATLDASATASLILSEGRNHAPVSAPGPIGDLRLKGSSPGLRPSSIPT